MGAQMTRTGTECGQGFRSEAHRAHKATTEVAA